MLSAAQQAEDEYASTQRIAREAIGLSQAFPIGASAGGSVQANIEYLYIRSYGQTAFVTSNLRV
jgi:hypothetical protein